MLLVYNRLTIKLSRSILMEVRLSKEQIEELFFDLSPYSKNKKIGEQLNI